MWSFRARLNFTQVRFDNFFQGCFSDLSENGKKTGRKHKNELIIFFVGKFRQALG